MKSDSDTIIQQLETLQKDNKLRFSGLELIQILEQSPSVIVITNTHGNIEYTNPRFYELTGYSREEALGKNPRILKSGDKPLQFYKNLWATISSGKVWHGEFLNKKKNGELFWEEASISAIKNNDGLITHYVAIKNDITIRKKAEQALVHSELRFRNLTQTATDAIISINKKGSVTFWNAAAEKMFGYAAKEIIGKNIHEYIVPDTYKEAALKKLADIQTGDKTTSNGRTIEIEGKHSSGKLFPIELSISTMDIDGSWHAMAILRDITMRKQTEQNLKQNKQRLRQILNNVMGGIIVIDAKSLTIDDANDAACNILDEKLENLIGASCCPYICSKKDGKCPALSTKNPIINKELTVHHKDGTSVPIVKNITRTMIDGKEVFIENFIDISHRKKMELQLKRSLQQNQQLLRSISSGLVLMDENEKIIFMNKRAIELFNLDKKNVLGKSLMHSGIQWQWEKIVMAISECRLERKPQFLSEVSYEVPDKHFSGFLKITISPYLGSSADYPGFLILADDITESKIMESQLNQAQKLESIGQLAAGIAHEINTPTQFVGDNTRFLKDAFDDVSTLLIKMEQLITHVESNKKSDTLIAELKSLSDEADVDYLLKEIPQAINQSLEGIDRVAKIVRAMKEFSHPGNAEKTPIDINKSIANTITVSRNEWKYVATLETDFDENLPPVPCYPDQLNQVILNLIINAAHTIKDALENRNEKMGIIKISTKHKGEKVIIRISDTGMGIPAEIRNRIFDPFFTTKEVGRGTGQGLAISFDVIVKKHGGDIYFDTVPDQGTTFIIELPLV